MLGQTDYSISQVPDLSMSISATPDPIGGGYSIDPGWSLSNLAPDFSLYPVDASSPVPTNPVTSGGDWFSGISGKDLLSGVVSIGGAIAKAVTGQPTTPKVPTGYRYNPLTGQIVPATPAGYVAPSTMSSWLPILLIGGVALFAFGKKK